ncbi:MAG TPA: acetyl/propionyl/methylcrotonyl-CoA carboxylase subunit alpha [Gammaproteobacteria bacterium]|nr:acetyl/propionyl/methylcrotonyl-CoA carboxylase subunit alpha [Gammaproteobacteria bacterium]
MFKKILIANRGEIACRVIRSAQQMGVATVAVYSTADQRAKHVEMADEAVCIGPPAAAQSYLRIDAIVNACRQIGAQAVHPGYGFLSENAALVVALEAENIAFIGPPTKAMQIMGDKIISKRLAQETGVSTIPGYTDVIVDAEQAVTIANDIGYPVLLKASAGGGGKGMRVARNDAECRDGFARASSEAATAFGDDRMFLEKYIEGPRHIEIQIMADQHGHVLYLGERECSIQRRHQKVIEEAPSVFIDAPTRAAMGQQAVALARAVDYCSAGTVEFIVDQGRNFYFLEMNTRLQVEHPVTECVTGLDLVELMIRVAAGEPLPLTQEQVRQQGWAVECRVYAEDSSRGFLPSIGRLSRYHEPRAAGLRVDSGVKAGSDISMYYDPMISKLVAYGADRKQAIAMAVEALDQYLIEGVAHNGAFLQAVLLDEAFGRGDISTDFIGQRYPDGFQPPLPEGVQLDAMLAVVAVLHDRCERREVATDYCDQKLRTWVICADKAQWNVDLSVTAQGLKADLGEQSVSIQTDWQPGDRLCSVQVDGKERTVQVQVFGNHYRLAQAACVLDCRVLGPRAAELDEYMLERVVPDRSGQVLSPMPGMITQIRVQEGDEVQAGTAVAVIEAMKMENLLYAARDGVIAKVLVQPGEAVQADQVLLQFA